MFRRFLLVSLLCTSLAVFAQKGAGGTGGATSGSGGAASGPAGPAGSSVPGGTPTTAGTVGGTAGLASSGAINPPSGNTGVPTMQETVGGPAGNTGTNVGNPENQNVFPTNVNNGSFGGFGGGGVLATPSATFASPEPTAGISDAGRAGVSTNSPVGAGVQNTSPNSTLVYTNASVINPQAINTAALSGGRLINDLGPSVYIGSVEAGSRGLNAMNAATPGPSVAEIAARYKAPGATQNARTITNADVERILSEKTNSGTAIVARNTPPPGITPSSQQGNQPGTASQSSNQTSATTSAQTGNPQTGNQGAEQSTPATAAPSSNAQPGTSASGTTPEINQQQQSGNKGNGQLPATATILPLLGLLGVASGGVGLWYRKFRK